MLLRVASILYLSSAAATTDFTLDIDGDPTCIGEPKSFGKLFLD